MTEALQNLAVISELLLLGMFGVGLLVLMVALINR